MLKAKLHAPNISRNIISRDRLMSKLQRAQDCKLTLVTAPAGYGKTTAVLDWLGKCGLPYAWLSLDDRDNDPVTFWNYVCAALEDISDGIAKNAEYVFASRELMESYIHVDIIIDRLSEVSSDFILVLDDLHLINTPSILNSLSHLIDYLPAKMHLVFISRTLPELELAKHRIKWQTQHLEEDDLRFGGEEISRFYQARGITLRESEIELVEKFSEGWAAALVAVTLSMENCGGCDAIKILSHSSHDIEQYLKNEVILGWRPEKLSFALKTSILDTMWPDLCDAVTGVANSSDLLGEISEGNGFLSSLDRQKESYRYHHLFKNFLMKLLQETHPEEIPELHLKAGIWFRERDLLPEAIEHFLNGGAFGPAYELIEHQVDHLIHKNDLGRLLSWVERLPAEYRDNSFKSACIYAFYYAENGQYNLSRQWIDRMKTLKNDARYASIPSWKEYSDRACTMSEANLLVHTGDITFVSLISLASSLNGFKCYKMPEYQDFNPSDIYFYRCPISKVKNLLKETPGKFSALVEDYRRMISKNPGYAPLGIGEYLYENNRLEEALPYLLKAQEEAREANCPGALVPAMVNLSRLQRADGDITGAFTALEECEKLLAGGGKSHWNYLLGAYRCRLFIDTGFNSNVHEWLSASKLNIYVEINRIKEFELIIYARCLILLNRTKDARILLHKLLTFTGESGRLHSQVEVLNLLALLSFQENHAILAYRHMDESLDIGIKEGYIRSYLDEQLPMAQLLRAYIKSRRRQGDERSMKERKLFAGRLLKQMPSNLLQTSGARDEVAAGMSEKVLKRLTPQEQKVLELIVNAATNKEIGNALGISLRTVKTHTGNIYSKLGIKNRAQCVKLVLELGLL